MREYICICTSARAHIRVARIDWVRYSVRRMRGSADVKCSVLSARASHCISPPYMHECVIIFRCYMRSYVWMHKSARTYPRRTSTGHANRYACAGVQTRSAQCFARALYSVSPPNENNYERSGATCVHTSGCTSARAHIHVPPIDGCTSAGRGRGGLHI